MNQHTTTTAVTVDDNDKRSNEKARMVRRAAFRFVHDPSLLDRRPGGVSMTIAEALVEWGFHTTITEKDIIQEIRRQFRNSSHLLANGCCPKRKTSGQTTVAVVVSKKQKRKSLEEDEDDSTRSKKGSNRATTTMKSPGMNYGVLDEDEDEDEDEERPTICQETEEQRHQPFADDHHLQFVTPQYATPRMNKNMASVAAERDKKYTTQGESKGNAASPFSTVYNKSTEHTLPDSRLEDQEPSVRVTIKKEVDAEESAVHQVTMSPELESTAWVKNLRYCVQSIINLDPKDQRGLLGDFERSYGSLRRVICCTAAYSLLWGQHHDSHSGSIMPDDFSIADATVVDSMASALYDLLRGVVPLIMLRSILRSSSTVRVGQEARWLRDLLKDNVFVVDLFDRLGICTGQTESSKCVFSDGQSFMNPVVLDCYEEETTTAASNKTPNELDAPRKDEHASPFGNDNDKKVMLPTAKQVQEKAPLAAPKKHVTLPRSPTSQSDSMGSDKPGTAKATGVTSFVRPPPDKPAESNPVMDTTPTIAQELDPKPAMSKSLTRNGAISPRLHDRDHQPDAAQRSASESMTLEDQFLPHHHAPLLLQPLREPSYQQMPMEDSSMDIDSRRPAPRVWLNNMHHAESPVDSNPQRQSESQQQEAPIPDMANHPMQYADAPSPHHDGNDHPDQYNYHQPRPPSPQAPVMRELRVEDALSYLDDVKREFLDQPTIYNKFLSIMKSFKSQEVDTAGVISQVSKLFHGYDNLILGFNTFLPDGNKISAADLERMETENAREAQAAEKGSPQGEEHGRYMQQQDERSQTTATRALAPQPPPAQQPPQQGQQHQAVEFDYAISYVTTIKKRFENDPSIYYQFLEILHTYQNEQRGIKEVLEQVSHLFQDHPDLLKEFTLFLPDAVQEQARARLNQAAEESEIRLAAHCQQRLCHRVTTNCRRHMFEKETKSAGEHSRRRMLATAVPVLVGLAAAACTAAMSS